MHKKTQELRVCVDYRSPNRNNISDRYLITCIDNTLDRPGHANNFSRVYLASGYHQVDILADYYHRTAFQTRFSLFEYMVIPLGPRNSPRIFEGLMNHIFQETLNFFYTGYLDDILVYASSTLEHLQYYE